jgi:hypothetical protein
VHISPSYPTESGIGPGHKFAEDDPIEDEGEDVSFVTAEIIQQTRRISALVERMDDLMKRIEV